MRSKVGRRKPAVSRYYCLVDLHGPRRPRPSRHLYTVHFIPAEEGGYTVEVPALEGCATEGDTFEEAEQNAREAISLYLESLQHRGLPLPDDRETMLKHITVPIVAAGV
jgi:antitoxin HicB